MRHKYFGRKLNRDIKERKALFRSLVIALIDKGKIRTTVAKAKAIQGLVEKLVTKAKEGTDGAIRQLTSFLTRKEIVSKLTGDITPRFKDRVGGYVRIRKLGKRFGDGAEEVVMEWSVPEPEKKKEEGKKVQENTDKTKKTKADTDKSKNK